MNKLKFLNSSNDIISNVIVKQINNNIIKLIFNDEIPDDDLLSCGFEIINEFNNKNMTGDYYYGYITIYRRFDDEMSILLSNDGSVYVEPEVPEYVEPEIVVLFNAETGGSLDGEERQVVENYEDLFVPTPVPNSNYEFVKWNPEIPTSGTIENNITFTAEFVYVPTLEEVKTSKINTFSNMCSMAITNGVDVAFAEDNVEHFSYTEEDQVNLKEIFDLAVQTNVPMYYHADGKGCKLYTVEQIIAIYTSATTNKMHHTTYFNQIRMYINSLETKEEVEVVEYGQELTGEYLQTYNKSMAQAQLVLEALLAKRATILAEG